MKYMGSKNRIAKHILPIMLEKRTSDEQWWVEPFVGGANMIDKVTGNRLGSDSNDYCIEALNAIRDKLDGLPKNNQEFTEEMYIKSKLFCRDGKGDFNYEYAGYISFACSYSGKWFRGWCRDGKAKRDYVKEAYRNAEKQSPLLKGCKLVSHDYRTLDIPPKSIIYCDPPYESKESYKDKFNHDEFWEWCREKAKEGHTVFVSEYNAPDDFECVWEKEVNSSLTKDTGSKKAVEKLFTIEYAN